MRRFVLGGWTALVRVPDIQAGHGLYMAADMASRLDPLRRGFRDRLLERGRTRMQGVVSRTRKLLMRMYGVSRAVSKEQRPPPERAEGA